MQFVLVFAGPDLCFLLICCFFRGKLNLSYFFGHRLWEYFFGNLFSLIAEVFNSPSFLTSETVTWQYQIGCFVYSFLNFPYSWHIVECHVLWFLPFPVCFCLEEWLVCHLFQNWHRLRSQHPNWPFYMLEQWEFRSSALLCFHVFNHIWR